MLGVIGSTVGLVLSFCFCTLLQPLSKLLATMSGLDSQIDIYYNAPRPPDWNWGLNLILTILAILLATLASWWPAQRVRSIEIQEALRS